MTDEQTTRVPLSEKLNRLVTAHSASNGRPLSNKAIATGASELGEPISESFVYYLRSGQRSNPTLKTIEGIARFFEVPVSYFIDDDEFNRIDSELDLLMAMRDADVRSIAMRAQSLSPGMRRWVAETLRNFPDDAAPPR